VALGRLKIPPLKEPDFSLAVNIDDTRFHIIFP
jgi:hypothetical protein